MSIDPVLKAAARSAFRNLYRASSATFLGDEKVLHAFRMKMRNDAVAARAITDPELYEQQNTLAFQTATFLRRNVVQGVKVSNNRLDDSTSHDTYNLRLTKHTELGNNDSIKDPQPLELSNRRRRKQEKSAELHKTVTDVAPHNNTSPSFSPCLPMNFSKLKYAHRERIIPEIKEEDLEEKFVRGSGPGGQSVNKTENNVQLLHKPTGVRVTCQETRSLEQNRRLARKLLVEKLDKMMNPGLSKEDFQRAKQRERERRRRKKAKKKAFERDADDKYKQDAEYMLK